MFLKEYRRFLSDRLLKTFLEMVQIDSPSGNEGLMRDYLMDRFLKMGLTPAVDNTGNLIVEVPKHRTCQHDETLLLSGHMDVVPPCFGVKPVLKQFEDDVLIQSDGTTVLGADDKSGLAPIVEAVAYTLENDLPCPAMRLVFTTEEETSMNGAKGLSDEVLDAQFAITLDHTGPQGTIINQAPTYVKYQITCFGKSAHAAMNPDQGVNAIAFAGQVIQQLKTGRLDLETTSNIGLIQGGKAVNVVPDKVVIEGEIRSHSPDKIRKELASLQAELSGVAATVDNVDYLLEHHVVFESYHIAESHRGCQQLLSAMKQIEMSPMFVTTNGGSDNNIFVKRGLPGVVLSASYIDPHALTERVHLSEMSRSTQLLVSILDVFAHASFKA